MVTAQFILQSEFPLKTLVAVSQDFPKYQRKISKMALNETLKDGFQNNMMRIRDNRAKVWLNNQPVPHHKMNPFKYVATIFQVPLSKRIMASPTDIFHAITLQIA